MAPYSHGAILAVLFAYGDVGEFIENRARNQCFQPATYVKIGARFIAGTAQFDAMAAIRHHQIAGVEPEGELAPPAFTFAGDFDGDEGRVLHLDREFLDRRDQNIASVGFAP